MARCLACESTQPQLGVCCPACGRGFTVRDGAQPHPDEGDHTLLGTRVGERFVLVDVIGVGATGLVYEAVQLKVRRHVAVKVLRNHLVADADARRRFEREAAAASRINHPNLVTLYDFATDGGAVSYLAMELLDGRPLSELAPYDTLAIDVTVHLLRQLLRAVQAAHELGVVHRDLKPANLVIVRRPEDAWFLKVLDFGLARLTGPDAAVHDEAERRAVAEGAVFGTPLYMSPEQVVAERPVTASADLYAWGAIAYELVCGRPPFLGDSPLVVMNRHVSSPVPPLLPREGLERLGVIEPVITRCLAKSPEARYPDASRVLADLDTRLGLQQRSTLKVPEVDEHAVLDSDMAIELDEIEGPLPREAVAQAANASVSWLHKPPTGAPRWSIPGRDEPIDAASDDDDDDEAHARELDALLRQLGSKESR